jgi:hypothetical protein
MRCPVGIPYRLQFPLGGQVLIVGDSLDNIITWRALRPPPAKGN